MESRAVNMGANKMAVSMVEGSLVATLKMEPDGRERRETCKRKDQIPIPWFTWYCK